MEDKKIKILWVSDSSVATYSGFALVTREILTRLSKNPDYTIAELGSANPVGTLQHCQVPWKIYNSKNNQWCDDVFIPVVLDFKPDVVISLADLHMSSYMNDVNKTPLEIRNTFRLISHLPIDGDPLPSYWLEVITGHDAVACIHPYGERVIRETFNKKIAQLKAEVIELLRYKQADTTGEYTETISSELHLREVYYESYTRSLENLSTINHGANREIYYPVSAEKKQELREKFLIPKDWFVFCHVGRNSPRKMHATMFKAFKEVLTKYPKTFLLVGSAKKDFGWHLDYLVEDYGINPNNILIADNEVYAGKGFSDEQIAEFYQLSDCFVSAAYGGGFELCHLESMLCGLPQIGVKGAGSITQMVDGHGILAPAKKWNLGGTCGDCERPLVEPRILADTMKEMIGSKKRAEWVKASLQFANQEQFTWDYAAARFEELISKVLLDESVARNPHDMLGSRNWLT